MSATSRSRSSSPPTGCAPRRYSFHDPAEGLIWIEDLGERDLWSYRDESWAVRRPFYESALEEIAKLHRVSAADSAEIRADLPAQFDAALYLWEQHYFFEHCLGRHFGVDAKEAAELAALPALQANRGTAGQFPARPGASRFPIAKHHPARRSGLPDRFPRDAARAGGIRSRFAPLRSLCAPDGSGARRAAGVLPLDGGGERSGLCRKVPALRHATLDAGARRLRFSRAGEREPGIPRPHPRGPRFVRRSSRGIEGSIRCASASASPIGTA